MWKNLYSARPSLLGILLAGGLALSSRGEPLRELRSISSVNGKLQTDLVIRNIDAILNGHVIHGLRTYNGEFPGPTLRVHPGDTMSIRYINRLTVEAGHAAGDHHAKAYNSVNLHTHGLNISPEGYSDNVYLEILPGQWVPFEFQIPANHPTGLFWYHPHRHGGTSTQVGSALTGNLILTGKGDLDEVPEIAAAKKIEMIFNEIPLIKIPSTDPNDSHSNHAYTVADSPTDTTFAGSFPSPFAPSIPDSLKIYTLNGTPLIELDSNKPDPTPLSPPQWTMRPGEVQRWQLTHAGLDQFLNLVLEDEKGVRQPLYLVSYDAISLPKVDPTTDGLLLGDGNRVEFLVKAGAAGTVYHFKTLSNFDQLGSLEIPLAMVTVAGTPAQMNLPTQLNPPIARLPDIKDSEIVRKRTIGLVVESVGGPLTFTVDGVPFDPLTTSQTMLLDTAEEWLLTTQSKTGLALAHPFHIHVNWFQVVKINGVPVPPRWQDTVVIPFGGSVTIRHRFQQYPGRFVFHCHILPHEDEGMMGGVEVVDPKNLNALQAWRLENLQSFENIGRSGDTTTLDNLANIYHYAYGIPMLSFSTEGLPVQQIVKADGKNYLGFQFNWRVPPAGVSNPVQYVLFESTDLSSWLPVSSTVVGTPVDKGNGIQSLLVRDTKPIGTPDPARFLMMTLQTEPVALPITPDLPQ